MYQNFPLSVFIDFTNSAVCFFCGVKLLEASRRTPGSIQLRWFRNAYFFLVAAYLFFSIPRLFITSSAGLGVAFWLANLFLFLGTVSFARVTATFVAPRAGTAVLVVLLIFAGATLAVGIVDPTKPMMNASSGMVSWNVQPTFGIMSAVFLLIILIPSAAYFIAQAVRTKEQAVRRRSRFIAFGLVLLVGAAGTFYEAKTLFALLLSDLLSLLAFFSVFLGVFPRRQFGSAASPQRQTV